MKKHLETRHSLLSRIIAFYLVPYLCFGGYAIALLPPQKSWSIISFGLFLILLGTLIFVFSLFNWEKKIEENFKAHYLKEPASAHDAKVRISQPSSEGLDDSSNHDIPKLQEELQASQQAYAQIKEENQHLILKAEQTLQGFTNYKLLIEQELNQKNQQIAALQQRIEEQRAEMDNRQEQIQQFENKIRELGYEIKTLLSLNEANIKPIITSLHPSPPPTQMASTSDNFSKYPLTEVKKEILFRKEGLKEHIPELSFLLKRCVQAAQKLTGSHHLNSTSEHFSFNHSAIDQRHLFEIFKEEKGGIIFVCSPQESKPLFANQEVKAILGWSSEKFTADFLHLIPKSINEWKSALHDLDSKVELQTRLLINSKNGEEKLFNCHLEVIPAGIFQNYIIGVLSLIT